MEMKVECICDFIANSYKKWIILNTWCTLLSVVGKLFGRLLIKRVRGRN